jgi:hypothetical protein
LTDKDDPPKISVLTLSESPTRSESRIVIPDPNREEPSTEHNPMTERLDLNTDSSLTAKPPFTEADDPKKDSSRIEQLIELVRSPAEDM